MDDPLCHNVTNAAKCPITVYECRQWYPSIQTLSIIDDNITTVKVFNRFLVFEDFQGKTGNNLL